MTRGPKPKPTALKRLQGNPGKRKIKTTEVRPPTTKGPLERPIAGADTLAADFLAKYTPTLQALGLLTDVDQPGFELAAKHYAFAWKAAEHIEAEGMTITDDHHEKRKHPLLGVFRDNSAAFRAWVQEFGMSPSARTRVQFPEAEQLSLLEQELFGDAVAKK